MRCNALRHARRAAGFTYRDVSSRIGLDPTTLANCEAGRSNPSARTRERWAAALVQLMTERRQAIDAHLGTVADENGPGTDSGR